ncbi:MAG: hypothetical protein HC925_08115 [Coleofasciculaceae cyanobacterium SM2_3_26]|nr:hypothetical protein [Coleofasciculaceae cyanobacterium SM2_3_26]
MTEATLPPFIHQMLQPGFYPHPVREPVRLLQTHVSYVLLTGDYAYKLKKSVNFGFLDYSTLDKRRHFCEEEVRLNQRGAAAWYLGVVPITETDGQYHLEGAGDPVEYALKMREFPQDRLFLHMLERGELGDRHMETLGKVVSDFHATCHTDDYIRAFGEVDRVRQSIDENYAQTEKYVGDPQSQAQLDATKAYSDAFFAQRFECFQERQQQDKSANATAICT